MRPSSTLSGRILKTPGDGDSTASLGEAVPLNGCPPSPLKNPVLATSGRSLPVRLRALGGERDDYSHPQPPSPVPGQTRRLPLALLGQAGRGARGFPPAGITSSPLEREESRRGSGGGVGGG